MSHTMPCQDAVRRLWGYLDGELDEAARRQIEEHLTFCLRCCGELEFAQELRSVLHDRQLTTVPTGTRERLESFIDDLGRGANAGGSNVGGSNVGGSNDGSSNDGSSDQRDQEQHRDP